MVRETKINTGGNAYTHTLTHIQKQTMLDAQAHKQPHKDRQRYKQSQRHRLGDSEKYRGTNTHTLQKYNYKSPQLQAHT